MEQQNRTVTHTPNPHQPAIDSVLEQHTNNIIVTDEIKVAVPVAVVRPDAGSDSVAKSEAGGSAQQAVVVVKRGRGRPRKYDRNGGGPLSPATAPPPGFPASPVGSAAATAVKRGRGRPRGSGKLQIMASMGVEVVETAGGSFTPHVMTVYTGEDVVSKIQSFFHKGPRSVCIISATGPVSTVLIRSSGSAGVMRHEGRFEILSLSGSCTYTTCNGAHHKNGRLSVLLAKPDGTVFGGAIETSLIAAGPIQLVMATFQQNITKQTKRRPSSSGTSDAPSLTDTPDSAIGGAHSNKVPKLLEAEQQSFLSTTPLATNGAVPHGGVVHSAAEAASTNGGGGTGGVIPAVETTNGASRDLNMHSSAFVVGLGVGPTTEQSMHADHVDTTTSVPRI